jgi:hypothetical protein
MGRDHGIASKSRTAERINLDTIAKQQQAIRSQELQGFGWLSLGLIIK